MKRVLKAVIAGILCLSIVTGVLPMEIIGQDLSRALAAGATGREQAAFQALLDAVSRGEADDSWEKGFEGEWTYALFPREGYAVITGHLNTKATSVEIPDQIGGADVVGVADGTFEGQDGLSEVTVPGNVMAMGRNALPAGVAVCGTNASYGQSWARKNGHGFRNISRFEFREGVVDFSGIRRENFDRISAEEVRIRKLEASRLSEGTLFYYLDPANQYQISYYRAERLEEGKDGFVTVYCSTPMVEDVLIRISVENEVMVPDYSTLRLEPGVTVERSMLRKASVSPTISIPLKIEFFNKKFPKNDDITFSGELKFEPSWKVTYDLGVFSIKRVEVEETKKVSVSLTLEGKYEKKTMDQGEEIGYETLKELAPKTKKSSGVYRGKMCSFAVYSLAGVVNVFAEVYCEFEFSAKGEISYSNECKTVYKYHDGQIEKEASSSKQDVHITIEGEAKVGVVPGLTVYVLAYELLNVDIFIGVQAKATLSDLNWEWSNEQTSEFAFKWNMFDCISLEVFFVVEGRITIHIGSSISVGPKLQLLHIPLFLQPLHIHWLPNPFVLENGKWKYDKSKKKDNLHYAGECPYDTRNIIFYVPNEDGKTYTTVKSCTLMKMGEEIGNEILDEVNTLAREASQKKVLGWYTDPSLDPKKAVQFPAKIWYKEDRKEPTEVLVKEELYAKLTNYRTVHLINSSGKELEQFSAAIHGEEEKAWTSGTMIVGGEDTITMPMSFTLNGENHTALQWWEVNDPQALTKIGFLINPGSNYAVNGDTDEDLWLMALTADDGDQLSFDNAIGTMTGYSRPAMTPESDLTFDGETVTGIRNGADLTTLNIPAVKNDGTAVTAIAPNAFSSMAGLTRVYIPSSIKNIGTGAFSNCPDLKYIEMNTSKVTDIPSSFCYGCGSLLGVAVPNSLNSIGTIAFYECAKIASVQLKCSIGQSAFEGCTGLGSGLLGGNDIRISAQAFKGCTGLTELTILSGVTGLGDHFIIGCTCLATLKIAAPLTLTENQLTIGAGSQLETVVLQEGVKGLGERALANGSNGFAKLKKVFWPTTLTSVGARVYAGSGIRELNKLELAGVNVAEYAFSEMPELLKVTVLSGSIPKNAFYGDAKLKKAEIWSGLIGEQAFAGCAQLETAVPKEGVTGIGIRAFYQCSELKELIIPDSVKSLGPGMIQGCVKLTHLKVGKGIAQLSADYSAYYNTLYVTPNDSSSGRLCNPFYIGPGSKLNRLELSEGITSIGGYVFANATMAPSGNQTYRHYGFPELHKVEFPKSLTSLQAGAFRGCGLTELELWPGLASAASAFSGMTTLQTLRVHGGAIGENAFSGCTGLTNVDISGATGIGTRAFYRCTGLTKFEIPDSVTSLWPGILQGCTNVEVLEVGGGIQRLSADYSSTYDKIYVIPGQPGSGRVCNPFYIGEGSKLETLKLGDGIRTIGSHVFANASMAPSGSQTVISHGFQHLKYIDPPSTLTSVEANAFQGSAVSELALKRGLVSSDRAFSGMKELEKITIPGGSVGEYAFSGCSSLREVNIPGVTSIGTRAFYNCTGLTSLTIPDSVTQVWPGILQGCVNLEYLRVSGGLKSLSAEVNSNSSLYATSGDNSVKLFNAFYIGAGSNLETLVIGEGITSIAPYIFANATSQNGQSSNSRMHGFPRLTKVILPSTLTSLGAHAFDCSGITELDLGRNLASANYAFSGMTSLEKVTIRGGSIGQYAFSGCTGLKEVNMEGVWDIQTRAFYNCTGLASLTIPDSVTQVWPGIIQGCVNLKYLRISGGLKSLSAPVNTYSTLYVTPNNYSIKLFNGFYIGEGSKLETLVLGEGITSVGPYVLANSTSERGTGSNNLRHGFPSLRNVILPSTLTSLGSGNISAWGGVTILTFPDGIYSLPDGKGSRLEIVCTNLYSSNVSSYAGNNGLIYRYGGAAEVPAYTLTCVVPIDGTDGAEAPGSETVGTGAPEKEEGTAEGAIMVTRGTGGEAIALPEGFRVLSETETSWRSVVNPAAPETAEGYAFYGWYTDPEYREPWKLGVMPSADLTLYARIKPMVRVRYAINLPSAGTADESLPEGFALWREYLVREGSARPVPESPSPAGYALEGWYLDTEFRQIYLPKKIGDSALTFYGSMVRAGAGAVYQETGSGYTLTSYRMTELEAGAVRIPGFVNGRPVTAIGANAFSDSGIRSVAIPDSVTQIDPEAFSGTGITAIYVSASHPAFSSVNGVLYSKDGTMLIRWPAGKGGAIVIPDTVTALAEGAFAGNSGLTEVTFGTGLAVIGDRAFRDCTGLTAVSLPDSVTELGVEAFDGCVGMTDFTAYGLMAIGAKALPVGIGLRGWGPVGDNILRRQFAFETGVQDETLVWNYNLYTVHVFLEGEEEKLFTNEAGTLLGVQLRQLTFDDGTFVRAWYTDPEMTAEWRLDEDWMPAAELTLYGARMNLYDYEEATVTAGGEEISGIRLTRYNGTETRLTVPVEYAGRPVIAIGSGFLSAYGGTMTSITIPASVMEINATALINAAGEAFTGTVFCDNDSYTASWADGTGLERDTRQYRLTLELGDGKQITYDLGKGAGQKLEDPVLVGAVFTGWYLDAEGETQAELISGVYTMPGADTTLYAIWTIDAELLALPFTWREENGEIMITGYTGDAEDLVIPTTVAGLPVTGIGEEALRGLPIRSVDLGMVRTLGKGALSGCPNLTEITLTDSVESIGSNALGGCEKLETIRVGKGLWYFPAEVAAGCASLREILVSGENESMKDVDGVLFSRDGSTLICYPRGRREADYAIPAGTAYIETGAFKGNIALQDISFPASVTSIGNEAFMGCAQLRRVEAVGLEYIGEKAFFGCSSLTGVVPGDNLRTIGSMAFAGCPALETIRIPESVELDENQLYFNVNSPLVITGLNGSSAQRYAAAYEIAFNDPRLNAVTAVSVQGEKQLIAVGEIVPMTVTLTPADAVAGMEYTWRTTDENVAFVDDRNQLHGIGVGSATVTAVTANGVWGSFEIKVQIPVEAIYVKGVTSLKPGETMTPVISVYPMNATDQTIRWETSDDAIAAYDEETGTVRAIGEGKAVLTVFTNGGARKTLPFKVFYPMEGAEIQVAPEKLYCIPGADTRQAAVSFLPENTTDQAVTWSSSNPEVLSIDESGRIQAVAPGTAVITASGGHEFDENWTRTWSVTIPAITNILSLPAGLKQIFAEAFDGDGSIQGIILGDRVESIGENAFANMTNLRVIVIPASVREIDPGAFTNSSPDIVAPAGSTGAEFAEEKGLTWLPVE